MILYGLVLQVFVMALFSFMLLWLSINSSEALAGLAILVSNIGFSLFMVTLNQPEITAPLKTPEIVWTPFTSGALAGELVVIVLSVAVALFALSRRRDHI